MVLTWVGLGCAVGLIAFSQVLGILLARYRNVTMAVLTGFMMGSLLKIWPWKHTTSYQLKPDGTQIPVVQEPVWPQDYEYLTGLSAEIGVAAITMIAGAVVITGLDYLSQLLERREGQQDETVSEPG